MLLALLLVGLVAGMVFRYPLVLDDPFITYRYAQNLIAGHGFVYNPGEHVLSTTTPLYALVLAASGLLYPDIPALGFWLSVVGLAVCAWSLYLIGAHFKMRLAGAGAALLVLISPSLVMTWGLETGLYLALAFGAFALYLRGRVTLAFALLALLTLTRNDGVLLAGIIGAHFVWTRLEFHASPTSRSLSLAEILSPLRSLGIRTAVAHVWQPFAVFSLILLPWLLFAWWWFGTPFPFTLTAKIAQAQSGLWDPFGIGALKWFRDWIVANLLFGIAAFIGLGICLRRRSVVLLLVLWALTHLVGYTLLGVAFYPWYIAPLVPVLALVAGIGVEGAGRWLYGRIPIRYLAPAFTLVGLALMLVIEWQGDFAAGMALSSPKTRAYTLAAQWLAENTPPDATVDALEVGVIGYYDHRRTVDFVGLVEPARVPFVRAAQFAAGVRLGAADYLVAIPPDTWLNNDPWFNSLYQKANEIRVNGFYSGKPLVIYRRVDSGRAVSETVEIKGTFDRQAELASIDLFTRTAAPGDTLPIVLHLRSGPMDGNKFTLQLVGASDRVLAQSDVEYPPRPAAAPVAFADHLAISIPRTTPPGKYQLILALYNAERAERASLYDPNGNEAGDFVSLGEITVLK